jgi:hypothetical protein
MLNLLFGGGKPRWVNDVEKNGLAAKAVILSDPRQLIKDIGGYEGDDKWIDVQISVQPANEPAYEAAMKCKLSQATFGLLEPGITVNIKYDAKDKTRVLLVDDVNTLLQARVKK